jgi:hypothetical protein
MSTAIERGEVRRLLDREFAGFHRHKSPGFYAQRGESPPQCQAVSAARALAGPARQCERWATFDFRGKLLCASHAQTAALSILLGEDVLP